MDHKHLIPEDSHQGFELWTPSPGTVFTKQVKRHTLTMHPTTPNDNTRYIECEIFSTTGTSLLIRDETVEVAMASLDDYKAMFDLVAIARCPNCFDFLLWERDATMVPPLCQDCAGQGLV